MDHLVKRRSISVTQLSLFAAALVLMAMSQSVLAQSSNGQITGLVTDSTGAAVEGASIIATNTATGVAYATKSNGSGVYVVQQLVPGPYKVSLSKDGFATVERTELTVRMTEQWSSGQKVATFKRRLPAEGQGR